MKRLLLFLFPLLLLASEIETVLIPHPESPELKVEFFLARPQGKGPFPIIYLLHGYQYPEDSNGGKKLIDYSYHTPFIQNGIMVCSISMPGFGQSEGALDFCGPFSQQAVLGAIHYCKNLPEVDQKRMGLYGISRGAILASMVSTLTPDITLQILEAGRYDFLNRFANLPSYLKGIQENIINEVGTEKEALLCRSAVYHADKVNADTLILHGEFDDRMGLDSAQILHKNLVDHGVHSQLVVFPNATHILEKEKWEIIVPLVRKRFLNLAGIGINIGASVPIPQVTKVLPSGPSEGKLRVGDAILAISPNNDEELLYTRRLPTKSIVQAILGKPGTPLRLSVMHFDQSTEEIVLFREN